MINRIIEALRQAEVTSVSSEFGTTYAVTLKDEQIAYLLDLLEDLK